MADASDALTCTLAFYRGSSRPTDWIIQIWTSSPYSHVELATDLKRNGKGEIISFRGHSASPRDGGVRSTHIDAKPGHWDFIEIPGNEAEAVQFIEAYHGYPYDWPNLFTRHILKIGPLPYKPFRRIAFLCSEIVPMAVGLGHLTHLDPGAIHDVLLSR